MPGPGCPVVPRLEPGSAALPVYRAHILFKPRDRYLNGSYGDDRALAMYSVLEGEVVGVNEAVVWSAMLTTAKLTYKQRLGGVRAGCASSRSC